MVDDIFRSKVKKILWGGALPPPQRGKPPLHIPPPRAERLRRSTLPPVCKPWIRHWSRQWGVVSARQLLECADGTPAPAAPPSLVIYRVEVRTAGSSTGWALWSPASHDETAPPVGPCNSRQQSDRWLLAGAYREQHHDSTPRPLSFLVPRRPIQRSPVWTCWQIATTMLLVDADRVQKTTQAGARLLYLQKI